MKTLPLFDAESMEPTWKNRVHRLEIGDPYPFSKDLKKISNALISWYQHNQRPLPWRESKDPYRVWISEVMLQQTTVKAVIPHYQRFIARFPSLEALAQARLDQVLEQWAGLGYYSRAKNLHLAARELAHYVMVHGCWPKTHQALLEFTGFGPYTARAVASIAFGDRSGVLDGNVNRVLCRLFAMNQPWWTTPAKNYLQSLSDQLVTSTRSASGDLNQALMELGATVCTPKSPSCFICPCRASCRGVKAGSLNTLPLPKPRKQKEIWLWSPVVVVNQCQQKREPEFLLSQNAKNPFLKGHLVPPGGARKLKKKPDEYLIKGVVTHHEIYVKPKFKLAKKPKTNSNARTLFDGSFLDGQWIRFSDLKKRVPSSLVRQVLEKTLQTERDAPPSRKR